MKANTHNKPLIGGGIYTLPDVADILQIPYHKVSRCVKEYWDARLATDVENQYSWTNGKSRAVSFYTLIELFVYIQLTDAGVKTKDVLKAHLELSELYNTPYPFATQNLLIGIKSYGKKIYFERNQGEVIDLDGTRQFNLSFLLDFVKNIEFDNENLATKLWPIGKDHSIVVDPEHQFGQPTIDGTNVRPSTIYQLHQGGEPDKFIAMLYELSEDQVKHSIEFCTKRAA